ncbi:DUF6286 domain-containing protein [Streptomyces sp. H10-C2]|uniref:DUF6286 domain-containing protein n=1 Tax=unclassified Streptomyces TaxID=2593676 RepID=UPI0024B8F4F8|nr:MULTISPECIES: DUF6286 domain-containing protein [unclassified Streptomyces]MDJ0346771.1 DUF6286 domain-containing protein [Streptomyces sp. PH10-H1]MDJ0374081.1 DUF6286 domain-containing protein [Streptomyces sp. H10-C2]
MRETEPESITQPLATEGDLPSGPEQSASGASHTYQADATAVDGDGRPVHRFWSARRVAAGIVALLAAAATGLLLYDVAAVRADRPAMRWRRRLADELATRHLDDTWMIAGAAVAMAIGLWLIALAATPGLRSLLPMRPPTGDPGAAHIRAGLGRSAAALVLRDRAMEVPGVQSVRVDVSRRQVNAQARAHFRDIDEVRADLDAALTDGVRQLGLARQPVLFVHVRRPKKG